jgi:hypothetical protein
VGFFSAARTPLENANTMHSIRKTVLFIVNLLMLV